ncbi:MAG: sodium-dependent transporter [Acidobacteriota bacterium]
MTGARSGPGGLFSSRYGTMLAMVGMAVGTGNIWRFPREAASNGGGEFLVAWVVFLLLWSVPLIMVEFALGKETRKGPVGAVAEVAGGSYAWMGAWIAFVATAIMFYYSVVMGWTVRYLWGSLVNGADALLGLGGLASALGGAVPMASREAATSFWESYVGSGAAVATHGVAMGLGVAVVARGVEGIERAVRVLLPALLVLVVVLAVRAVTLPGASRGLEFLFSPDWAGLADPELWLRALSQNAWDTGAGWGLIVAYAVYLREREDTALNSFLLGFGNNSVSLLAGIMVLCTVFAVVPAPADEIAADLGAAGNEGLTFMWIPQLFGEIPLGSVFMILFFGALMAAAWSSLISMIELASRVLVDAGVRRKRAVAVVGAVGFVLGLPSALSIEVFRNQDWVWGVGLLVSGLFFAVAVLRYGVDEFRERFVNAAGSDIAIGRWWNGAIVLVTVLAAVLVGWWLWQAVDPADPAATLTPFSTFNVGTVVVQWTLAVGAFLFLNRRLARLARAGAGGTGEGDEAEGDEADAPPGPGVGAGPTPGRPGGGTD